MQYTMDKIAFAYKEAVKIDPDVREQADKLWEQQAQKKKELKNNPLASSTASKILRGAAWGVIVPFGIGGLIPHWTEKRRQRKALQKLKNNAAQYEALTGTKVAAVIDVYKEAAKLAPGSLKGGKSQPSAKAPAGEGSRFAALKEKLSKQKGVTDPGALAASIGRAKFGKKKFQNMAAKGK